MGADGGLGMYQQRQFADSTWNDFQIVVHLRPCSRRAGCPIIIVWAREFSTLKDEKHVWR